MFLGKGLRDPMSDESNVPDRPLIGFTTGVHAPPISPAPINRTWMSETRRGWANRCLPLLIANQGGWELRNPSAFTATWMGGNTPADLMIVPDTRAAGQLLPASNFGYGILTWHLPILFRTPPGYDLLVRGPADPSEGRRCRAQGRGQNRLGKLEFQHDRKIPPQADAGAVRDRRADLHD